MSEPNLKLNNISSREFILSPAVQSGNDRECTSKDFYQDTKNNIYLGCLGAGLKVKHCKTYLPYTILNFEKEKISKLNYQEKINSTLELMYKSTHPYMFRLLNNFETDDRIVLIFEPFEGDSLDNLLQKEKYDLQTCLKYFVEIILAINHMNDLGLYNLNIRPENILVDECVKITDYGLKMTGKPDIPKRAKDVVTIGNKNVLIDGYFSPEEISSILNKGENNIILNSKLDSWKCGILLFEMLTNFKSPFGINSNDTNYISFENELTNAILKSEIDLSLIKDKFCKDLISKLLKKNPKERMDIADILNIDFIKKINIEQREIDLNDNIINPEEEESDEEADNDDRESLIKKLMSENEILKKKLSQEFLSNKSLNMMNSLKPLMNLENSDDKNKLTKIYQSEIFKINDDKENIDEDNDINKSDNNSFSEEDFLEDKNNINNNNELNLDDSENIYTKYQKLKEKYISNKKKLKEMSKKVKSLKEELSELKSEKNKNAELKNLNLLNDFEKINLSKITNITELSNVIFKSLNIFKESQNNFQNLIEKLIKISGDEHKSLIEESKKYLDNKGKMFFDELENLNKNKIQKEKIEENEEKKSNIIKDTEISELKKKYELSKQRENLLKEKIKALEDRNNASEVLNKKLMTTIDEMYNGTDNIKKKK